MSCVSNGSLFTGVASIKQLRIFKEIPSENNHVDIPENEIVGVLKSRRVKITFVEKDTEDEQCNLAKVSKDTDKRDMRTPMSFQPWKKGDTHAPMAVRMHKSIEKQKQTKFMDMRKQKETVDSVKEDTLKGDVPLILL